MEVPRNHKEALKIDMRNGNNVWTNTMRKERQYRKHQQIISRCITGRDVSRLRDRYNAIFEKQPIDMHLMETTHCGRRWKERYKELFGLLQYITRFGPHDVLPTLSDLQNHVDNLAIQHLTQLKSITCRVIGFHQEHINRRGPQGSWRPSRQMIHDVIQQTFDDDNSARDWLRRGEYSIRYEIHCDDIYIQLLKISTLTSTNGYQP